jgi:hypothetical protein
MPCGMSVFESGGLASLAQRLRGGESSIEADSLRYARDSNPAQATCLTQSP